MKQNISILGCGWLGKPLAVELIKKDYLIKGSTTSDDKLEELQSKSITPYLVNLNNKKSDISEFLITDILIIAITSKNIEGFKHLITQIEKANIKKVIFISSTSVYPNINGTVTEESPTKTTALSGIEQLFRCNTSFKTTIVRFGGLFGHNRKPGKFIKPDKKIDNPNGYINFIHQYDCIQIIEQIITQNVWGETFNACSDSHPKRRDFYTNEMRKIGRTDFQFNENTTNSYKIVNSEKLKKQLNYKFKYSNLME